jgi:arylsulfatase A-like enzyme
MLFCKKCFVFLAVVAVGVSLVAAERPPNIIVIMVDDMGYGGVSCYDNPHFKTPEIDRLASEGLLLTDFHSNGSVCSPTRAALMTGRYQYRSGCHVVINADPSHPDHVRGLRQEEWTFAEAMKTAGYATAVYGKWHLGYTSEFHPLHHGFDEFAGFISGNIDAHSHYDRVNTFDWWQGDELKDEPGYHTDLITEHTIDFIERNKDQPFFIYAAHGAPHSPHQARGSKIQRGPGKGEIPPWGKDEPEYSNEPDDGNWLIKHFILPVDEGVGRIRQRIEDLGLAKDTIIWFISDNGGTRKNLTKSPQTRGGKGAVFEGGHRVPGIVWAPGRVTPGNSSALVIGMDIMPTSMALAGVSAPKGVQLDGIDIGPALFEGETLLDRPVIWGRSTKNMALRKGPWKLVNRSLYNLDSDPRETTDVAAQHPERVEAMAREMQEIFKEALHDSPYDHP